MLGFGSLAVRCSARDQDCVVHVIAMGLRNCNRALVLLPEADTVCLTCAACEGYCCEEDGVQLPLLAGDVVGQHALQDQWQPVHQTCSQQ